MPVEPTRWLTDAQVHDLAGGLGVCLSPAATERFRLHVERTARTFLGTVTGKYPADGEALQDLLRRAHRRARSLHEVLTEIAHAGLHDDLALVLLHTHARNLLEANLRQFVDATLATDATPVGLLGSFGDAASKPRPEVGTRHVAGLVKILERAALQSLADVRQRSKERSIDPSATPARRKRSGSRSPAFDTLIADLAAIFREVTGSDPKFSDRPPEHDTPRQLTSRFGSFALAVLALLAALPGREVLQADPQWRPVRDRTMDSVREAWRRISAEKPRPRRRRTSLA